MKLSPLVILAGAIGLGYLAFGPGPATPRASVAPRTPAPKVLGIFAVRMMPENPVDMQFRVFVQIDDGQLPHEVDLVHLATADSTIVYVADPGLATPATSAALANAAANLHAIASPAGKLDAATLRAAAAAYLSTVA